MIITMCRTPTCELAVEKLPERQDNLPTVSIHRTDCLKIADSLLFSCKMLSLQTETFVYMLLVFDSTWRF